MASVWVHNREQSQMLKGHLSMEGAKRYFEGMVREWRSKGGLTRYVDQMEVLLFRHDGKLLCGMYIEAYSPPSAMEPGQPKREKA